MSDVLKPPSVPVALLNFFAQQPDFPALSGDMSEEFHQRVQTSGAKAARRWYWFEAFRNALALTWRELMRTPIRTLVTALGCILAVNAATGLYAVIRWYFSQGSIEDFLFNERLRNILLLLSFLPPLAMGWVGGRLLRGREWALALMFTLIYSCLALIMTWYLIFVIRSGFPSSLVGYVIAGHLLRQGSFWLGCLWIRRSRSLSLDRPFEAADGN